MATETLNSLFGQIRTDAQKVLDWGTKARTEFARPKNAEYDKLNEVSADLKTKLDSLEVEVKNLTDALEATERERDEYRSKVGAVPKGFFGKLKYAFTH